MAMINIKEGTTVFVPWRIQGIVRNEERILNYKTHLLEKQNKYLLNCITRNQLMAANKLEKFNEKFSNAARVSVVLAKEKNSGKCWDRRQQRDKDRPWRSHQNKATAAKIEQQQQQSFSVQQTLKRIGFSPTTAGARKNPTILRLKMKL